MLGGPIVVPAALRDDEEALQWVQRGLGCAPERDGEHEKDWQATLPFGALGDMACALLRLWPESRLPARVAATEPGLLGWDSMVRLLKNAATGARGPFSLVRGPLDPALLVYLQEDPVWDAMVAELENAPGDSHGMWRRVGHIGAGLQHGHMVPLQAPRVRAFVRAFVTKNSQRLLQLQTVVRRGLATLPEKHAGENGRRFLMTDILSTAFFAMALSRSRKRKSSTIPSVTATTAAVGLLGFTPASPYGAAGLCRGSWRAFGSWRQGLRTARQMGWACARSTARVIFTSGTWWPRGTGRCILLRRARNLCFAAILPPDVDIT
jgi:hypothetical protein